MLITSGGMVSVKNLNLKVKQDAKSIKKRYQDMKKRKFKTQEDYERFSVYRKMVQKIKKGKSIFPDELLKYLPFSYREIRDKNSLNLFINNNKESLVGFISGDSLQRVINQLKNNKLKITLKFLRNTPMDVYLELIIVTFPLYMNWVK